MISPLYIHIRIATQQLGMVLRVIFRHIKGDYTPVHTHTDSDTAIRDGIKGNI